MRMKLMTAVAVAAGLMATGALAQDPKTAGEYRQSLQRMIDDTGGGECPADLMAEGLLNACREQIDQMAMGIASLGAVTEMRLVEVRGEGAERVEIYDVDFQHGVTLRWGIGHQVDGKFSTAYAGRGE